MPEEIAKQTPKTKPIKMPVCPFCKAKMTVVKFVGYYDEFTYWSCDCMDLPNPTSEAHGCYG